MDEGAPVAKRKRLSRQSNDGSAAASQSPRAAPLDDNPELARAVDSRERTPRKSWERFSHVECDVIPFGRLQARRESSKPPAEPSDAYWRREMRDERDERDENVETEQDHQNTDRNPALHVGKDEEPSMRHLKDDDDERSTRTTSRAPTPPLPPPTPPPTGPIWRDYKERHVLRGHQGGVSAVKFSPDGTMIASSSADATIKIWDTETGRLIHTFEGHLAGVSTISWNPDSTVVASGSDDKSIRLWNVSTGKPHPVPFLGHHNYIYSIAFSPKGNMLVSGSYDEAVFLWDVRSARVMRSLPAHSDPVSGVDVVRDGTLIASCASDGLIRIWDTGTGQCLRTLVHEDNPPVSAVRFSPNGKYVLAWTHDDCVRLWDYVAGKCVKTYQGHVNKKYSLCGGFGIYGGHQARPNTTHGANDNEKHRNPQHSAAACAISGSEDGMIICWDVVSKQVLQHFRGHDGVVLGVDTYYNADKRLMVSCGLDRTVKVWEACFDENTDKERDHIQVKEDMLHGVREHAYPTPARVDASLKNEGEPEQALNKVNGVSRDSSVKMEDVDSWEGT